VVKDEALHPVTNLSPVVEGNNKVVKNSPAALPSHYVTAATSDNTRKAYQSDIRQFMNWGGLLPATTDTIVRYLHEKASELNHRTLSRHLTALSHWHHYQSFPDPTSHPLVKKTLAGIKNIHGKPKQQAKAMTLDELALIIDYLKPQNNLIAIRNNALIQLCYFGAFRRSELVTIKWQDISFSNQGIQICIPKSKTDQSGEGQMIAIPYGNDKLCAVTALKNWQEKSKLTDDFVFRRIDKAQRISELSIRPSHVNYLVKSLATTCKLDDAELYSAHSLRRGFATEASRKGATFKSIMQQGRWKSQGTVLEYIEAGQRFEDNAIYKIFNINQVT